jgi:hypothetical protein
VAEHRTEQKRLTELTASAYPADRVVIPNPVGHSGSVWRLTFALRSALPSAGLERTGRIRAKVGAIKRDRDEVFVEFTKSVCPVCNVVVDAQVNIRAVYLGKRCREQGQFEALVYGDAQAYLASARFNKPGRIPLTFQTEVRDGCPSECGLCPEHKQHACLGIIEVNTTCNLDCPICFADSATSPTGMQSPQATRQRCRHRVLSREGRQRRPVGWTRRRRGGRV